MKRREGELVLKAKSSMFIFQHRDTAERIAGGVVRCKNCEGLILGGINLREVFDSIEFAIGWLGFIVFRELMEAAPEVREIRIRSRVSPLTGYLILAVTRHARQRCGVDE